MADILITGGSGYLGRHFVPMAAESYEVIYTYLHADPHNLSFSRRMDVRDQTAVLNLITEIEPRVIIHTVGSNRGDSMREVIVTGAKNISKAAESVGARLIHLSTDVVFNGRHAPYNETAPPTPIHEYGRAKAQAEEIVGAYDNHIIIRTSLIYGLRLMDHGTRWMADALRKGLPVTLFTNQRRNPIWVQTLSEALLELAGNNYTGILNVAGSQEMSRAEFGLRMLDWWQIKERDTLTLAEGDRDQWPPDCTLDLSRARKLLATPLPGVDDVLAAH